MLRSSRSATRSLVGAFCGPRCPRARSRASTISGNISRIGRARAKSSAVASGISSPTRFSKSSSDSPGRTPSSVPGVLARFVSLAFALIDFPHRDHPHAALTPGETVGAQHSVEISVGVEPYLAIIVPIIRPGDDGVVVEPGDVGKIEMALPRRPLSLVFVPFQLHLPQSPI